jgi:hypothetical protein
MKVCIKCNTEKDVSEYNKHPQTKDKLQPQCRPCLKIYKSEYRAKNKEALSTKRKEYYRIHNV